MVYKGKYKIIDNLITACDYDFLLKKIDESISKKSSLLISPIASHTLVRAHYDKELKKILDRFDYLVPDSQWVRWSIPFLYGKGKNLEGRVYGPELMLRICRIAEHKKHKVFFYGNTKTVLKKLKNQIKILFPKLKTVGYEQSKFRGLTKNEEDYISTTIRNNQANIVFVSLGSPRQEVFSFDLSEQLKRPLIIIPVGAAFDFISKNKPQASDFIKSIGFEWFFRFITEPGRLLFRYFIYGTLYIFLILYQKLTLKFRLQY